MATPVTLPALGESVTEGTVTRWLKQPGDTVTADEPLLEVSTDKVDTEIPAPAGGVLLEIKVSEDETVEVGTELAVIGDASESTGDTGAKPAEPSGAEREETTDREEAGEEGRTADAGGDGGGSTGGSPVTMPALGESVTEGTITRWLKQPGDHVDADEPLLEVSTDKVDTEIPSPAAGVLLEIKVGEDETVEVGTELAVIGSPDERPAQERPAQERPAQERPAQAEQDRQEDQPAARDDDEAGLAAEASQHAEAEAQSEQRAATAPSDAPQRQEASGDRPDGQPTPPQAAGGDGAGARAKPSSAAMRRGDDAAYVTPLVRRLAAERGVNLGDVSGTGVGGRIRKQDVLAAAEAARQAPEPERAAAAEPSARTQPAPAPAEASVRGTTEKLSRLRKLIAQRMVESLQTSAQLTTVVEVDVTRIGLLRDRAKAAFEAREGTKLSFLPFFAKATLDALKQHPKLNATVDTAKGEVIYLGSEDLGIAVDTERGLLVPVIKNAGDLNIAGLARRIADLAERTRTNKIAPDELSGGSFTLTNTGSRGALFDTPIINQPQVGILGTGAVVKRPVVLTDEVGADVIAIRSMVYLALTYDHRLVDGADAARFLATVKQRLEQGSFEGDLGI